MKFIRSLASLVLLFCVVMLPACAPQPADCAREDVFCVGLVTASEGVENHGLNQITWETLQNLKTQAQIARLDTIESVDLRDWQKNIIFFADNDYDLIVTAGRSIGETMTAVAVEYPDVSFIGVDQEFDTENENVATIDFPEDQAGFLAGMLASMVSNSGKVGAVCEASGIDSVWQYCEGFRAGALYEGDDISVTVVYRNNGERDKTFNDPEWGKQELLQLLDKGVDTMTSFGGNTAQGAFLAANEKEMFIIGSEEDLYFRLPEVQPFLITSIFKDPSSELSSLVLMVLEEAPISGTYAGDFSYALFRLPQFQTDVELKSNFEDIFQKIKDGEIEITLPERK